MEYIRIIQQATILSVIPEYTTTYTTEYILMDEETTQSVALKYTIMAITEYASINPQAIYFPIHNFTPTPEQGYILIER